MAVLYFTVATSLISSLLNPALKARPMGVEQCLAKFPFLVT
jgi:hypothetical protein